MFFWIFWEFYYIEYYFFEIWKILILKYIWFKGFGIGECEFVFIVVKIYVIKIYGVRWKVYKVYYYMKESKDIGWYV